MASSHIFKIMFVNQGKVYEIYARKVGQGRLFGFIEVEELVAVVGHHVHHPREDLRAMARRLERAAGPIRSRP